MQDMDINVQYAGFFTRFAAFCIDSFIAGVLLLVVRIPMLVDILGGSNGLLSTKVLFEFSGWDIVIYLLTCLYFVVLTYYSGATIGKRLLKIKVISSDGEKLSFLDILYRETIGRFLCNVTMNMGYILVGIDKEKRGFHDMLCDTRVVYDLEGKSVSKGEDKVKLQNSTDVETKDMENVNTETWKAEISDVNSTSERRVSLAPSNYGYVSERQKSVNDTFETEMVAIKEEGLSENNSLDNVSDEDKENRTE